MSVLKLSIQILLTTRWRLEAGISARDKTTTMATPVKVSASAVIPSVLECIACSKENKQKYFVVKRNGEKGPAYLDATGFYDVDLWSSENFGAFLCLKCHRDIKRLLNEVAISR